MAGKFIDAYVEGVWNVYDGDLSGYLDKKEAKVFVLSLLDELANEGVDVPVDVDFDAAFASYDQDGNGRLSRKEARVFVEHLMEARDIAHEKTAAVGAETQAFLDSYMAEIWTTYDGDASGFLERDEARKFVDKLIADMTAFGLDVQGFDFDACFNAYDQDKNGRLSRTELRVFVEQLLTS
ncbi:hypothetical protein H310_06192 [Aphanomyces invadans]|uniref:EF-hand domain-containing protein n=1 Tax=Aphanomyces invadans TaxID=157072 RepID=A0A024U5P0_9STRA|nr:hypothetical protein H310_06192 [Aphanomyces invadans]ETW01535.1 hypothetical protein H310_06192 [Aphanomyces invadans]RHY26346.1 hypothetical protein DYB32_009568 [Aphanomyces invadans]|eukprot:XP_008869383.1 hypothetical protein H310_06192 [Aphanomyces invadans]